MKRKTIAVLLMVIALISAMMMTACGGKSGGSAEKQTLESFVSDNPDVKEQIDQKVAEGESGGVKVDFSGNDIIYTYDLSNIEDMTEELAKSDTLKETLQSALDEQASTFKGVASQMEDVVNQAGAGISGVRVIVNYIYGDEVIVSGTFEPEAASDAAPAEGEDSEG